MDNEELVTVTVKGGDLFHLRHALSLYSQTAADGYGLEAMESSQAVCDYIEARIEASSRLLDSIDSALESAGDK